MINMFNSLPVTADSKRILIVDDNPEVRADLRTLFELIEDVHVVGEASNGQVAIWLVRKLKPDVVIMDLEMPIIDGFKSIQIIRDQNPDTKVIVLSIHNEPADRQKAFLVGASHFFQKGEPLDDLIHAVSQR